MRHNEKEFFMNLSAQLNEWLETPKAYVLIPDRVKLLSETCSKLHDILTEEGYNCKIEVAPCKLGFGDMVITFDTDSITIRNIHKFYEATHYLSNFEIYPIGDERLRFAGIFDKVAMVAPL